MKFIIKDKRFIQKSAVLSDYIQNNCDANTNQKLIRGLTNIKDVVENVTEFTYLDHTCSHDCRDCFGCNHCCEPTYLIIENKKLGAFMVREDNITEIPEISDILASHCISKIIRNGNKTILIDNDNQKFFTTKQKEDEYDLEKAVMILLLKKEGYSVNDIYSIISSVK